MDELFPNFTQPVKYEHTGKKCRDCRYAGRAKAYWSNKNFFFCEIQAGKNFTGRRYIKLKNEACCFWTSTIPFKNSVNKFP